MGQFWTFTIICLLYLASETGGIVVTCVLSVIGAATFSLCAWLVCCCHEKCRKDRIRNSPGCEMLNGQNSTVFPDWASRLICDPNLADKGFSEISDGFHSFNGNHLVRQRAGLTITDGARWGIPLTNGKHVFEIIWPWGCRGQHATVGLATKDVPIKVKGSVNLVGGNSESWGLDIVRRRAIHNNRLVASCPSNGSYVSDRFLMYVDLDLGRLGFGCDVTFWGFVINNLPVGTPLYVMVGADKWQARVQVYYRGSAVPEGLDGYLAGEPFSLVPNAAPKAPAPLLNSYQDIYSQPGSSNGDNTNPPSYNDSNSNAFRDQDWKPEPPPSPTAPPDSAVYQAPPPYNSPPPTY